MGRRCAPETHRAREVHYTGLGPVVNAMRVFGGLGV
jgi:hypothetical protein